MSTPPPGTAGSVALLRRVRAARPAAAPGERCEMCAEPITDQHQHVVGLETRQLMCTCRPCYLLFAYDEAHLRYRAVPDRYLSFPDFEMDPATWDDLQIPVGLAFCFRNSAQDRIVAFYPSPAGATESELPLESWARVEATNPRLATTLRPDVEALLLRREERGSRVTCLLVPIDVCYELVGTMRQTWRGFDGGQEAREALAAFFARAEARATPVEVAAP